MPMTWLDRLLMEKLGGPGPVLPCAFDSVLEALCAGLPLEDSQELREERAAILEYQAGFSREEAELRANGTHPHGQCLRS